MQIFFIFHYNMYTYIMEKIQCVKHECGVKKTKAESEYQKQNL